MYFSRRYSKHLDGAIKLSLVSPRTWQNVNAVVMNGSQCIQSIHDNLFIFIIHTGNYLQCCHNLLANKSLISSWNRKKLLQSSLISSRKLNRLDSPLIKVLSCSKGIRRRWTEVMVCFLNSFLVCELKITIHPFQA